MFYGYFAALILFAGTVAVIDSLTFRIPDFLLLLFTIIFLIFNAFNGDLFFLERLIAAVVGFTIFYFTYYTSHGLGFGDVKYAAVLGFALGLDNFFLVMLLSAFLAIILFLFAVFLYKWPRDTRIPFGSILSAATFLIICFNNGL